ncbi:MAG: biotin--[acetyl-CoA-carboxylase] ligase [Acidobacteriales bacterium]|nr:biotin--[acetyl-CoA-carboxylase] ligase [Terriglobales bacterium]
MRLLVNHATVVVSGTKIAQEIGSNRAEVWRLIQRLRELGVEIAGRPATGYRLESMPDLLLPDLLAPLVRGTLFADHIHHYYKIGSTNTAAMKAGAAGAAEGSVFLAEQQTEGRGRGAHTWHSTQSDGIYCSVLLRPSLSPSEALLLSLAAGLAVKGAINEIDPKVNADLKWPNDLLIDGKKFCGILTEMNAEVTRVRYLVVGVGINVNHGSFPAELKQATSLRLATGTVWSRMELCAALLKSLDREYRMLSTDSDARQSIIRRFEAGSTSVRGREVEIENGGGVSGVTAGLDARGFLLVRGDKGIQTILSGTVRLK